MSKKVEMELGGKIVTLETGKLAKQADAAVLVQLEDTMVLVTVVASKEAREGGDFLPLTVEYREKAYAAGKIPGGFFKREGRPAEKEVLTSRLIDRPLRPLFPEGFFNEIQVIATVLSADQENDPDILSIIGASAALTISDVPFAGPIAGVRVGRRNGEFIINPTYKDLEDSDLNLIVAGTRDNVVMVEGGANELPEDTLLEAIIFAQKAISEVVALQIKLLEIAGVEKRETVKKEINRDLDQNVREFITSRIREAMVIRGKLFQKKAMDELLKETFGEFLNEEDNNSADIKNIFYQIEKEEVRSLIIGNSVRTDGRSCEDIRQITCEIGILPRAHGSALFTRGETQSLVVTTLGTAEDEQRIDALAGETSKAFMLHYNFPPFSVGEARFLRSPGRREIGHGALAERALSPVMRQDADFPYTIRIVSDVLESNGSSSMATVCGGTLALMDAGVPIKAPVAGIAMGLIKEEEKVAILSDILGIEDHLGDMDFKVTGTKQGVTALQMDIKIQGITEEIMGRALKQAREGRLFILDKMNEVISESRKNLSPYAPQIISFKIKSDKVRDVIGPGGKMIRSIIERTGVKINIEDDGTISIASTDEESANEALKIIKDLTQEAEIGKIYSGTVKKIMDFGAFVEIFPGTDGLLHISQMADYHVKNVSDEVKEGEEISVKVLDVDRQGKIKLSRKQLEEEEK